MSCVPVKVCLSSVSASAEPPPPPPPPVVAAARGERERDGREREQRDKRASAVLHEPMGEKHLQVSLCDVAAGRASVAFVRVPSVRLLTCALIVAGALVGDRSDDAAAGGEPRARDGPSTGTCTRGSTPRCRPTPDGRWRRSPARSSAPLAAAARAARRRAATAAPARRSAHRPRRAEAAARGPARSTPPRRRAIDACSTTRSAPRGGSAARAAASCRTSIGNLHDIAARGAASRARACRRCSRRSSATASGGRRAACWPTAQRVEFSDSELVWQYYPGEGIELQVLGTFGKANGLWMAKDDAELRALLDEMVPLAAAARRRRSRGSTTSTSAAARRRGRARWRRRPASRRSRARAQRLRRAGLPRDGDAGAEAVLARAAGRRAADDARRRALPASTRSRPAQASSTRSCRRSSGSARLRRDHADSAAARRLFRAGDRQARARRARRRHRRLVALPARRRRVRPRLPQLLRDFLRNLCDRTRTEVYCTTGASVHARPEGAARADAADEARARAQTVLVRFEVSKVSRVGMTIRRGGRDDGPQHERERLARRATPTPGPCRRRPASTR